jgi:hypothetical protein
MIRNHDELAQAVEQMARLYRALTTLREEVLPVSPDRYGLLSQGPLDELRRLESAVHEYSGRAVAETQEADVWIRIAGAEVIWPDAPTSVLTNFLDTFRKGVQAATEWMSSGSLAARPTQLLKHACDFRVVGLQPGSLSIGVRIPEPPTQTAAGITEETVREALGRYLTVAAWAGSDLASEELGHQIPDAELRRILLTYVKQLSPRPRGTVEVVELYGRAVPQRAPVQLTRDVHRRLDAAIDAASTEQIERHVGEVREIDLDRCTFKLRQVEVEGTLYEVECEFEPDLYDSAVAALDRRVEVTGVRRVDPGRGRTGRLKVTRLVIVEEDELTPEN